MYMACISNETYADMSPTLKFEIPVWVMVERNMAAWCQGKDGNSDIKVIGMVSEDCGRNRIQHSNPMIDEVTLGVVDSYNLSALAIGDYKNPQHHDCGRSIPATNGE